MSANRIHYWLIAVALLVTAIGMAVLLGPGEAVLIAAVTLPFTLALLFVHEQHISAIKQCAYQYLMYMKFHK